MAPPCNPLPDRLNPGLPLRNAGVWRGSMFGKQKLPARLQHPAHFVQHPHRVLNRAERKGADHRIEAFIGKGDRLSRPGANIVRPAFAFRSGTRERQPLGRRVNPGIGIDSAGVVEVLVQSSATTQFENRSTCKRHDLFA